MGSPRSNFRIVLFLQVLHNLYCAYVFLRVKDVVDFQARVPRPLFRTIIFVYSKMLPEGQVSFQPISIHKRRSHDVSEDVLGSAWLAGLHIVFVRQKCIQPFFTPHFILQHSCADVNSFVDSNT